jgi:heme exporter protein A
MQLVAEGLSLERNGRVLFSNLSFNAKASDYVELRGANGAGKSSLLRCFAGLLPQASGQLTWNGESEVAQQCHYAGHQDALKNQLTARENLQFWADMFAGEITPNTIATFNLSSIIDEPVAIFSAGQRRRLSLSRLLVSPRPIWLLDEPTTALDHKSQTALIAAIKNHREADGIVIAATHGDLGITPSQTLTLGEV